MNRPLRFLPEVEDDAVAGYRWYEQKSLGLGEDFLRMFYACASEIGRNPLRYPTVHSGFRRRLLRRFPYAVYYITEGEGVLVCGLFHCARDPRGVQTTLRDRHDQ